MIKPGALITSFNDLNNNSVQIYVMLPSMKYKDKLIVSISIKNNALKKTCDSSNNDRF